MKLDFTHFADSDLDEDFVEHLLRQEAPDRALHFGRLWAYYKNDLTPLGVGLVPAVVTAVAVWMALTPGWEQKITLELR